MAAPAARGGEALLERLVAAALAEHPRVAEARAEERAALALRGAEDGFLDPRALVAAGAAREERGMAGVSREAPSFAQAAGVQAGVERAFRPGFYLGAGLAEHRRLDPPGGEDRLYRRTVGVRLRVPVLRDRGFATWHAGRAAADSAVDVAMGNRRQAEQDLARDVALRLVDWLHGEAKRQVAEAAAERVRLLQAEAEELVRLEMVPAYQVLPARLEVALRREELDAAEQEALSARRRLVELAGDAVPAQAASEDLLAWVDEIEEPGPRSGVDAPERVGRFLAALGEAARAGAEERRAVEELRSDVSFEAGFTWRGEGEDGLGRAQAPEAEHRGAAEAAIVWRRSLGARAERGGAEAARARVEARARQVEALWLEMEALADVAHRGWSSARERLEWVRAAVRDARSALDAEDERFRLGEGASRQVLEAQKDLTAVLRRQVDIAAELLRERARFRHAQGLTDAGADAGEKGP